MTPADFRAWMDRLGLTLQSAADALGVTTETIKRRRRFDARISRETELACQHVEAMRAPPGRP